MLQANAISGRLSFRPVVDSHLSRGMIMFSCEFLSHAISIGLGCNMENMPLYDILNEFQMGYSHIVVVYRNLNESSVRQRMRLETSTRTATTPKCGEMSSNLLLKSSDNIGAGPTIEIQDLDTDVEVQDSQEARTKNDTDQQTKTSSWKKFPSNEEVVGVITMESLKNFFSFILFSSLVFNAPADVLNFGCQDEISDETDEYVNIHNR
ncbi:hypothetical protein RJ641_020997 [Dillenia turbinata]|uniref:Uncharacterized protein n=1 Tax=Dillenia turbinata TaxID=194707 RepID=A0AAN8UM11_9MAGN